MIIRYKYGHRAQSIENECIEIHLKDSQHTFINLNFITMNTLKRLFSAKLLPVRDSEYQLASKWVEDNLPSAYKLAAIGVTKRHINFAASAICGKGRIYQELNYQMNRKTGKVIFKGKSL